jgi:hypothetical protein
MRGPSETRGAGAGRVTERSEGIGKPSTLVVGPAKEVP